MDKNYTKIYIGRTSSLVKIPKYETELAAAMDVRSVGRYIIFPQQKVIINTGLVVAIQSVSSLDVRPRSGLSFKTPLEISNSPGTIDADYRNEIGIILKNTSLPSFENWQNGEYVKLWTYLKDNGMENGNLTEKDVQKVESVFGNLYDLNQKDNMPGIYVINPLDRVAQILMGDQKRIEFITEDFLIDKEIETVDKDFSEETMVKKETIRKLHLELVFNVGNNRGGGFGSTGI